MRTLISTLMLVAMLGVPGPAALAQDSAGKTIKNGSRVGLEYTLTDDAGTVLEIIARPPGTPAAETRFVCHLAFWVDDFDAARDALQRRGVVLEPDSEVNRDEMRTAFFHDPDGNRCQIVWRARPLGS